MKLNLSIALSAIALSLLGILFIFSASSYSSALHFGDSLFYVKKQIYAFCVGLATMAAGATINLELLKKLRWVIYLASLALLALVFIPGLGVTSFGATRWINLGFTTIQPSEISKFGLMIFLAGHLSEHPPVNFKSLIVPLLCGLSMCVLIILEPNMSITICVGMALMIMLFVGGTPQKWFVTLFVLLALAVPLLIILEPYRMKRLTAFINPWENPKNEGYQLIQSYFALGSGGLFGVGLFRSRQKYLFLPFAESDFIFSVIGEEIGLIGCLCVIAVFAVFIFAGIKTAAKADSRYMALLATGITSIIAVQTVVNMAVVTGLIPPTGLPLPFVSAGGTALMVYMFCAGVLININGGIFKRKLRLFTKNKPEP